MLEGFLSALFSGFSWLIGFFQRRQGKDEQRLDDVEAQNTILKKQLDIAANPPSDDEELKRLREGAF